MKKFFARLITNLQPRMKIGEKRFLEDQKAHKEASDYNKSIAMEHERERIRDEMKKREIPSEEDVLGPSDPEKK